LANDTPENLYNKPLNYIAFPLPYQKELARIANLSNFAFPKEPTRPSCEMKQDSNGWDILLDAQEFSMPGQGYMRVFLDVLSENLSAEIPYGGKVDIKINKDNAGAALAVDLRYVVRIDINTDEMT
jgi:hypothetical protein